MGSKLRRLRVQAGVAGFENQSRLRAMARANERAQRLASCVNCGALLARPSLTLCKACAPAAAGTYVRPEPFLVGPPAVDVPRVPHVDVLRNEDDAITRTVGKTDEPRPRAAGMGLARRMPLLQQALVVSMLLGLASSPKEDR